MQSFRRPISSLALPMRTLDTRRSTEVVSPSEIPPASPDTRRFLRPGFGFLHRLSLRTTLLFLVTGTVVALTLLILASTLLVAQRATTRALEREFRATGGFLSQYLKERTHSMTAVCDAMGSQPGVIAYLLGKNSTAARQHWETVSDIANDARDRIGADTLVLTDEKGVILGRSPSGPAPAHPIRLPGVDTRQIEHPWQGIVEENGRPAVGIRVPVFAPGGKYVQGSFYAVYYLGDGLARSLHDVLGCDVAFVHRGNIIASSIALSSLPPLPESAQNSVQMLAPVLYSRDGTRLLGSYQRVRIAEGGGLIGVLLLHSYQEATALSSDLQRGLLGSAAFALLLTVALGTAVAKHLTRPLDGVVEAARQIQEGNWPERLPADRGDEIGLLQSAFNEMTDAVRSAQERLLARLDTDPLTELDNHRRFKERLAQEVERAAATQEPLSLLLVDIDRFRAINEDYGLGAGDRLLCQVAGLLTALPSGAIAARYGGDEFALLLPRTTDAQAHEVAESLRRTVVTKDGIRFTISIGYAMYQEGTPDPEMLLLAAEFAVTQAKHLGRNAVYRFDPSRATLAPTRSTDGQPTSSSDSADLQYLYRFLRDGSLVAIQAFAAAVDAKDHYTEGHSRRVAELSRLLAEQLDLSREERDRVYTSAILHDVGKIGVPDNVLQKQGLLDPDELRLMQAHPAMGEIIVARVPQLAGTIPGIRWHHERWDGQGYPDGLCGDEIPLVARIIAIADTFDAMTTDRPYRPGQDREAVLENMATLAGTQFDPDLVPRFVTAVRARLRARGTGHDPMLPPTKAESSAAPPRPAERSPADAPDHPQA